MGRTRMMKPIIEKGSIGDARLRKVLARTHHGVFMHHSSAGTLKGRF